MNPTSIDFASGGWCCITLERFFAEQKQQLLLPTENMVANKKGKMGVYCKLKDYRFKSQKLGAFLPSNLICVEHIADANADIVVTRMKYWWGKMLRFISQRDKKEAVFTSACQWASNDREVLIKEKVV